MTNHAPIKRHKALISFSKEHHFGLLLVWKVRQGLRGHVSAERIANYILFFFDRELRDHFHDEEVFLFPHLPVTDPLRLQAEEQHGRLCSMVEALRTATYDEQLLPQFAGLLEEHIRFEERMLFNHLQDYVDAEQLEELTRPTLKSADPDTGWDDPFWLNK